MQKSFSLKIPLLFHHYNCSTNSMQTLARSALLVTNKNKLLFIDRPSSPPLPQWTVNLDCKQQICVPRNYRDLSRRTGCVIHVCLRFAKFSSHCNFLLETREFEIFVFRFCCCISFVFCLDSP
jgi:hypothetical protein